jgi:hypothetical protein
VDIGGVTTVGGNVTVSNNGSAATVDIGGLTSTGGDVTITDNGTFTPTGSAEVTIGAGTVDGNLTVESSGTTVDLSGPTVTGNVDVTGVGATTVTASTSAGSTTIAPGSTTVTLLNGEASMQAVLPAGAVAERVVFSVVHLDPATLPLTEGVDFSSQPVNVEPVAAYQFVFGIPTLGQPATVSFDVNVAGLDPASQAAFLTALASDSVTLAVQGDAPGSLYQTYRICGAGEQPAGGCVEVTEFDANGQPAPRGTLFPPSVVRFDGVTGHFSTFAVGIVSPVAPADTTPPVFSGVPGTITAEATSAAGAIVTYATPAATDAVSGSRPVGCAPISGATFPLGTTTVTCSASDAAGNPASASFAVTVRDTTPPALTGVPANVTATATSAAGSAVTYIAPSANDAVAGPRPVTCAPASGSTFPVGTTIVTCTASDTATPANTASATFTVTVQAAQASSRTICTTLGGTLLLDVDLFSFTGTKGQSVTLTLAPDPAGTFTPGKAALALVGTRVLKTDASALPNVVTATLPSNGTYLVTVSEQLSRRGRFNGAYCLTLQSSGAAWQTFVRR